MLPTSPQELQRCGVTYDIKRLIIVLFTFTLVVLLIIPQMLVII